MEYVESLTADLYLSVISVAELFAGVKDEDEEKSLKQLLLAFVILPVTEKTARPGGLYRRDYDKSHGTGLADALIAATNEEHGTDLIALHWRHFPMVAQISRPY